LIDDGRGVDPQRVWRKAVEKGVVKADDDMNDQEKVDLIFAPGFSTAAAVSDLSGRGVGLDVVRQNIAALGGRVSVRSDFGHGARFTLTLPLTLAVVEAIACKVADQTFLVPITSVVESLPLDPKSLRDVIGVGEIMVRRGETCGLVRLRQRFEIEGVAPEREIVVIVEDDEGREFGIVVDALLGQFQVVVKSLERNYRRVPGIGAATILGDGQVALILDVATINLHRRKASRKPAEQEAMMS